MRKVILFLLLLSNLLISAQVRTEKEFKKMLKSGTVTTCIYDDVLRFNKLSTSKAISLKNSTYKDIPFNIIESTLIQNYDDVIISDALHNGYFVKLDNCFGLYDLSGNIIVPPIPGFPRIVPGTGTIYMGDIAPIREWEVYICNASGKARRAYSGTFGTVIDKETLNPIIPLGKFDGIHFTMKGISTYFYVSRLVGEEVLWGVYSKKGEELVPCIYSYVRLEKGEYVGDNSKKMEDVMASLKVILQRRQYNLEHPFAGVGKVIANVASAIGDAFVSLGEGIVSLDDAMQRSGAYNAINSLSSYYGSSTNSYSTYSSNDNSSDSYSHSSSSSSTQEKTNNISEQNAYNRDKETYEQCDSRASRWRYGGVSHTESEKRSTGNQMKNLRSKWVARGKSFPHSDNEDWCFK